MSPAPTSRRAVLRGATTGAAVLAAAGIGAGPAHAGPGRAGFTNPVIASNHPDPGILATADWFYLYSTAGSMGHMPVLRSRDLISWEERGNAMPVIAAWSTAGRHWAPEVIAHGEQFHAYYTARDTASGRQAVGVAVADHPEGPFVDDRDAALLVQAEEGGAIDPSPFRDEDGQLWLLWKNDGNAAGLPSYLYAQRLSEDGFELVGERIRVLERDQPWEIYTIEGPAVISHRGRYYLFYSAGEYWNESYGVGVAVADSVAGPWRKLSDTPVLAANDVAAGPGHGMPVRTRTGLWYVYHAWDPEHIGQDPGRLVWLSKVRIDDDGVRIDGPSIENPLRPVR